MYVLFDLEWVTAEEGTRTMTQLAALRTDHTWQLKDTFCVLVKPERGSHDWEQVAYNGYSPDEFWAGVNEADALRAFSSWLKHDDVLCCWHYQNGKTLLALHEHWFGTKLPCRWAAANHFVSAQFAQKKGIFDPGGLYQCAQHCGLQTPVPEHCSCNDVSVLQSLLQKLHLSPQFLTARQKAKSVPEIPSPVQRRAHNAELIARAQYHYIYSPTSPIFHRWDCKLALNARCIAGCLHYSTAAKKRRPCLVSPLRNTIDFGNKKLFS